MKDFDDQKTGHPSPPPFRYPNTLIFYLFEPSLKHFVSKYFATKWGNPLITNYSKMQGGLHFPFDQQESKATSLPRFPVCVSLDSDKNFHLCLKLTFGLSTFCISAGYLFLVTKFTCFWYLNLPVSGT
jgi:hypothetical protein